MKKYILFIIFITGTVPIHNITACPYGFSPEDPRPFFEQYEPATTPLIAHEKDEKL